jgi:hypothetical protein
MNPRSTTIRLVTNLLARQGRCALRLAPARSLARGSLLRAAHSCSWFGSVTAEYRPARRLCEASARRG